MYSGDNFCSLKSFEFLQWISLHGYLNPEKADDKGLYESKDMTTAFSINNESDCISFLIYY